MGGPFSATQVYTLTSTKPTPVTVVVTPSAPWISVNGSTSPINIPLNGVGASAKFAGSGGAIVGTYTDDAMFARLEEALGAIGCRVIKPVIVPEDEGTRTNPAEA